MQAHSGRLSSQRWWSPLRPVVLSCVVALCVLEVMGQEHDRVGKPPPAVSKKTKETVVDAMGLIDALVNHNPAPIMTNPPLRFPPTEDEGLPLFDKKYDWSEYDRANKAVDSLVAHAEEAWPELLKHFDDKRYCMTYKGDYGQNYSVGDMCEQIVHDYLVEGYSRHLPVLFRAVSNAEGAHAALQGSRVWWEAGTTRKVWCEKRKGKPLYELQIEMCEWAIARVAKLKDVSDEERGPFVKAVRAEITRLRQSKKAARFRGFSRNENFALYNREIAERIRKDRPQANADAHGNEGHLPPSNGGQGK